MESDITSLQDEEIDLIAYLRAVWRRKYLVAAVVAIALLTAGVVSRVISPVYEAEVVIRLSEHSAPLYSSQPPAMKIITTTAFLNAVRQETGLVLPSSRLRQLIRVDPVRDANMIRVRVRHNDPAVAKRLTESFASLFVTRAAERVQERRKLTEARLRTVNEQLREIQSILSLSREVLSRVQVRNEIAGGDRGFVRSFALNAVSISGGLYSDLQDAQGDLAAELLTLEAPSVVDPPVVPQSPIAPRSVVNLMLAATLGLFGGVAWALVAERVHTSGLRAAPSGSPELPDHLTAQSPKP